MTAINATVDPEFLPVADAFAQTSRLNLSSALPSAAARRSIWWAGSRIEPQAWFGRPTRALVFSGSKGAVPVCMGKLAGDGTVALDAPAATYWPEFARNGKGRITVRQLLSHRAGLVAVDRGMRMSA